MADNVGGIFVTIGADLSQFQSQMTQAVASATNAAALIGTAFNQGVQPVQGLTNSIGDLGDALTSFATRVVSIGAIEQLAQSSLEAYANIQKATIALTALTGSADLASAEIGKLRDIANQDAISFPSLLQANQRMTAFGISAAAIPGALRAAADAAAATGNSFDAVTQSISRLAESGTAGARQLVQLGLSTQDLARVMGVSAAEVANAFKQLDPTDRVEVIVAALQKYQGVAQQTAETIAGQWQRLQNETEQAFEQIGKDLAPAATALGDLAASVIPAVVEGIHELTGTTNDLLSLGGAFVTLGRNALTAIDPTNQLGQALKYLHDQQQSQGQTLLGTLIPGLDLFSTVVKLNKIDADNLTETVKTVGVAFGNAGPPADQLRQTINMLGAEAGATGSKLSSAFNPTLVSLGLEPIRAGTKAVTDEQTKLTDAVTQAQQGLAQLQSHYRDGIPLIDGTKVSTQDLQIAQDKLKSATDALNKIYPTFAESVGGLSEAYSLQGAKIDTLAASVQKLSDTHDHTQATAVKLQTAIQDLDAAIVKHTGGMETANTELLKIQQSYAVEESKILSLQAAVQKLTQEQDGSTAKTNELKIATDLLAAAEEARAKKLGLLVQSAAALTKESQDRIAAEQQALTVLNQLSNANDHTQAGQIAFTNALNQYIEARHKAGLSDQESITVMINGVPVMTTAANLIQVLKNNHDGLTSSILNGVLALRDNTTAVQASGSAHQATATAVNAHQQALQALQAAQHAASQTTQVANTEELKYQTTAQTTVNSLVSAAQAVIDLSNAQDGSAQKLIALNLAIANYNSLVGTAKLSTDGLTQATNGLSSAAESAAKNASSVAGAVAQITTAALAASNALDNADRSMAAFGSGASEKLGSTTAAAIGAWNVAVHQVGSQLFGDTISLQSNTGPTGTFTDFSPEALQTALNGGAATGAPFTLPGRRSGSSPSASTTTAASTAAQAIIALETALNDASQAASVAQQSLDAVSQSYLAGTATTSDLQAATDAYNASLQTQKNAQAALDAAQGKSTTSTTAATSATTALATATATLAANASSASIATTTAVANIVAAASTWQDALGNVYTSYDSFIKALTADTTGALVAHTAITGSALGGGGFSIPITAVNPGSFATSSPYASGYGQTSNTANFGSQSQYGQPIQINFNNSTISTQLAAQQLVAQVVTALRQNVRLSSGI